MIDITRLQDDSGVWLPKRVLKKPDTVTERVDAISKVQTSVIASVSSVTVPGAVSPVLSVNAVESPVKVQGRTMSQVAVSFTRDLSDKTFVGVRIWFKGYKGQTLSLMEQGSASPVVFLCETTGETVTVVAQSISSTGTVTALDLSPSTAVVLDGVVSAPPSPNVSQSLVATPTGYQFTFDQLTGLSADVIDCYRIYRNTTNSSGSATKIDTKKHSPTGGSVVVTDSVPLGQTYYYWVSAVNTNGLESTLAAAQSGQVFGDIVAVAYGKNLVSNPGFEQNGVGTPTNTDITVGPTPLSDAWYVRETLSPYQSARLDTSHVNTGVNCALIRCPKPGVSIPSDGLNYECRILSRYKVPVATGDVVRIKGQRRWENTAAVPAGVTITQRIGLLFYDASDNVIGELNADVVNTPLASYATMQAAQVMPATIGGSSPAYARIQVAGFVKNSSGSTLAVGANVYGDLHFDDISFVVQSTAFDLTPINTAGTIVGGTSPLTQSGVSTTINVAATTFQFGDGQISYNSGSVNPGSFGTWHVYTDDPTFSGGAVTYQATATGTNTVASNGRIYFGEITTAGGGGATGTGGGTGGGGPRGKGALVL